MTWSGGRWRGTKGKPGGGTRSSPPLLPALMGVRLVTGITSGTGNCQSVGDTDTAGFTGSLARNFSVLGQIPPFSGIREVIRCIWSFIVEHILHC